MIRLACGLTMDGREDDDEGLDLRVDLEWDDYNAGLFTEKLIRHVRRGEIEFDLEARSDPLDTTYFVTIAEGSTASIIESIAEYLFRRVNRVDRNLAYPTCTVLVGGNGREVTIREARHVREVIELAHEKVADEDQRNITEF